MGDRIQYITNVISHVSYAQAYVMAIISQHPGITTPNLNVLSKRYIKGDWRTIIALRDKGWITTEGKRPRPVKITLTEEGNNKLKQVCKKMKTTPRGVVLKIRKDDLIKWGSKVGTRPEMRKKKTKPTPRELLSEFNKVRKKK